MKIHVLRWLVRIYCALLLYALGQFAFDYVLIPTCVNLLVAYLMKVYSPLPPESALGSQLKRIQACFTSGLCGAAVIYACFFDPQSERPSFTNGQQ